MLRGRFGFGWMIVAWLALVVGLSVVAWLAMLLSSYWFGGSPP
jgi:hypothetical protein